MDEEQIIEDTSGFYRVDEGDLQYAPNFVYAPDYTLKRELKDTYTYPTQGGWSWFDSREEAVAVLSS